LCSEILDLALDGARLTPGAPADIILVNLDHPRAAPVHDVTSTLMLSTHGSDVDSVMVNGKFLVRSGHTLVIDESQLIEDCNRALYHLRSRAGL
jgi:5-methylthioadenosine/S-adenosylhomocysteine deaminase